MELHPFMGDSTLFQGAIIIDEEQVILGNKIGLDFSLKAVKKLDIIKVNNKPYVLATINNDKAQVYQLME